MNLIEGLDITTLKHVSGDYKYVHNSVDDYCIRSKYPIDSILDVEILVRKLPGDLGMYIYPHDAIICKQNFEKINKTDFNNLVKEYEKNNHYITSTALFDVPPDFNDSNVNEEDEYESEELSEEEDDDMEDEADEIEDWEEDDEQWEDDIPASEN